MRWSLAYIYEGSVATNINIADHWVNLKLSKTAAHRMEEESDDVIDSEHIALKLNEGVIVVVKGEPGMGKSTLVRKLCYDWMFPVALEGKSKPSEMAKYLSNYALLLPVELRSVKNCDNLIEMALIYLLPRLQLNLTSDQCNELLNEIYTKAFNGEVLMILDGFDEQQETKCVQLENILTNELYMPPCPLLITTRPEMLSKIDAAIEIVNVCGLKYDEQLNYVDVYCKNPKAKQRMKELLADEKNEAIQKPVKVPFFLAILCYMAEEQANKKDPNILPFPEQLGNIFGNFLSMSHQRIQKKFPLKTELTTKNLSPWEPLWFSGFKQMGVLAFEAFKNKKKVFSHSDFEQHSFTRELCLNLEFLTTGMHKNLIFLNDTFQEFFACYHLHDNYFKNYNEQVEKDMYSIDSPQRNDIRKKVAENLQELFNFRKIFADHNNCMEHFLAFFDSSNDYKSKMLWGNLNDNGQYVNEMNSDVLKRIKAADHFDKFKKRLCKHYDEHISKKTIKRDQWVDLTYRVKREKISDEMESKSFYELTQSIKNRPIFLYGSTLVGKTATLASIIVDWCNGKPPFNQYKIILFVPLSRFHNDSEDVFDLCLQYLLPKLDMETGNDYLHTSLKKYLCNLGKEHKLLLLFDDMHLFKANCRQMTTLLADCDGKTSLPAEMIISSSINYVSNLKLGPVGMLHVKGFTEFQQVIWYCKKYKSVNDLSFKNEDQMDECFSLPGLLKIFSELPDVSVLNEKKKQKMGLSQVNEKKNVISPDRAVVQIWDEYIKRSELKLQSKNDGVKLQLIPLFKFGKHLFDEKKRLFTKEEFTKFNELDEKFFQLCTNLGWIMKEYPQNSQESIRFQFFNKSFGSFLAACGLFWHDHRFRSILHGYKIKKMEQLIPYLNQVNHGWNDVEKPNIESLESDAIG